MAGSHLQKLSQEAPEAGEGLGEVGRGWVKELAYANNNFQSVE